MVFVVVGNKCDMESEYPPPNAVARSPTRRAPSSPRSTGSPSSRSPPRLPTRSRRPSRRTRNCYLRRSRRASSTSTTRYSPAHSAARHQEGQHRRDQGAPRYLQRGQ
jgi:hypothetical protein